MRMVTLTREQADQLQPAINYGKYVERKIQGLRDTYHHTINETNELIDMLWNGKINLTTHPFEFKASEDGDREMWYKIDGKIMDKRVYKQPSYWQPKRYQSITQSEFINNFLPAWKPEYEENIRFQYRNIFSRALAVVIKREKARDLDLQMNFKVKPQEFVDYPDTVVRMGENITIEANDRSGIYIIDGIITTLPENTWSHQGRNYEEQNGYPLLAHYRVQLNEFLARAETTFQAETARHAAFNDELKELLSPILISKELFLEFMDKAIKERINAIDNMICSTCNRHVTKGGRCVGAVQTPSHCPIIMNRIARSMQARVPVEEKPLE
jgi:hypothetical protein